VAIPRAKVFRQRDADQRGMRYTAPGSDRIACGRLWRGRGRMKRIGVLGGVGPQATIDFEARVHAVSQRLLPQDWSLSYPPMVVWYHRGFPIRMDGDGQPVTPREVDPGLVAGAAQLGAWADFLVI